LRASLRHCARDTAVGNQMTRTALQNTASIAGLMITTEAMVADAPKKDEPAMPAGGGMGGMGGMDF